VLLHDHSGFDSHLFIKKLRTVNEEKVNCIPKTEENYISFTKTVIVNKSVKDKNNKCEKE